MKKIIAANWKMNKTREQAHLFFKELAEKTLRTKDRDIVFFVPFTDIAIARESADEIGFTVGAQNFYPAQNGAFTGEVSAEMLYEIGCKAILAGHSERRAIFGETNEFINQKVKTALENSLFVLLCIGETLEERNADKTLKVLATQLEKGLADIKLSGKSGNNLFAVAYEPVWAIGTGKSATLEQISETHAFIKKHLENLYPDTFIPVLYGGSVNEKNAREVLALTNIDGVLVGGASLNADKFTAIINA
jgi:triosephosphate isomerase